jgi:hypothetical protein
MKLRSIFITFSTLLLYFLFAILIFGVAWKNSFHDWLTHCISGGTDPISFVWFLAWWPFAINHGLDPFVTKLLWAPSGVNLAWTTSIPSLAILSWPITAKFGPIASYNTLIILSPVLAAWSAFLMIREIIREWWPAFLGGYLFGFSTYEFGQLLGHLNLTFTAAIPLFLWVCILASKRSWKTWKTSVMLAMLLAFQFYTSSEIFTTFTIFLVAALACSYFYATQYRVSLKATFLGLAWGYIGALLLMSPILVAMFDSSKQFSGGSAPSIIGFGTDLLNYFIPTPVTWLGGSSMTFITHLFSGDYAEDGGYIGLPLLTILITITMKYWSEQKIRILIIMLGIIVVASFGPILHVAGIPISTAPWILLYHLPLLGYALPSRFMMYAWLIMGILVAVWVVDAHRKRDAIIRSGLTMLGLVCIFPNPNIYNNWSPTHVPHFFSSKTICRLMPKNTSLIVIPFGLSGDSMLYQAAAGMCFSMAEGYTGSVPYPFNLWHVVIPLTKGQYNEINPAHLASYISTYHVSRVAVLTGIPLEKNARNMLAESGMASRMSYGSVRLYERGHDFLSPPLTSTGVALQHEEFMTKWEASNQERNRGAIIKTCDTLGIPQGVPQDIYTWLLNHHLAH